MTDFVPHKEDEARRCEFVMSWGNKWHPLRQCDSRATKRYQALGGGFMHLCDEHSIRHLNYVEDVPNAG